MHLHHYPDLFRTSSPARQFCFVVRYYSYVLPKPGPSQENMESREMHDAVIVSTARTPIGKAYRGAFNDTQAQALAAHAITHAVEQAGIASDEIGDVVLGAALQQGSTHMNVARQAAIRAGLPTSVPGMTVDRQCSSGLMALSIISGQIRHGELPPALPAGWNRFRSSRLRR